MGRDRIKVLYITYNGVGESIFQSQCLPYLKGLSLRGHVITLLSYERNGSDSEEYAKTLKTLGIKWYRLRYHKAPRMLATFYDFLVGIIVTFYISIKEKVTIVHTRATHGALIGIVPTRLLGKKFIFDTRGLDSEEYVDGNLIRKNSILHKILFAIEKYLLSRSDEIVLLSQNAKNLFTEKGLSGYIKEGITDVIPCVTDLELFKPGIKKGSSKKDSIDMIYIGSVGTWYMLDEMLNFFKTALSISGKISFSIYTQSDKAFVMNRVKSLGIEGLVKVDYLRREALASRLSGADLGVCFIKPVPSKKASSPTKIGEYLASGLPVLTNSGIGDIEEIVKSCNVGAVIDSFTESSYKDALTTLKKLLDEKDTVKRCRETAEKYFSLNNAVEKYDKIYRRLGGRE